jgi:sugar-phosphatase
MSEILYCSAILFDLDGVLVNSTGSVDRHWRRWAEEQGLDQEKLIQIAHGRRTIEVVRIMAPHLDAESEVLKIEKREAEDLDGVHVMPGAAELLASIPEGRWGVVTSGTRYLATSRLSNAALPLPAVLIAADDVGRGKPHPEPYLRGASDLGVRADSCLVVEDAPAGIRAAHAAGMKAIAITSTYAAENLLEAEKVISKLSQLHVAVRNGVLAVALG